MRFTDMALSIDDVLGCDDSYCTKVPCPEWNGEVHLVPCASSDWDLHEVTLALARDNPESVKGIKARLVAACWADADGKRVAIPSTKVDQLASKAPRVINRLYAECERICTDIGPAEKNSESSPTEPS